MKYLIVGLICLLLSGCCTRTISTKMRLDETYVIDNTTPDSVIPHDVWVGYRTDQLSYYGVQKYYFVSPIGEKVEVSFQKYCNTNVGDKYSGVWR